MCFIVGGIQVDEENQSRLKRMLIALIFLMAMLLIAIGIIAVRLSWIPNHQLLEEEKDRRFKEEFYALRTGFVRGPEPEPEPEPESEPEEEEEPPAPAPRTIQVITTVNVQN